MFISVLSCRCQRTVRVRNVLWCLPSKTTCKFLPILAEVLVLGTGRLDCQSFFLCLSLNSVAIPFLHRLPHIVLNFFCFFLWLALIAITYVFDFSSVVSSLYLSSDLCAYVGLCLRVDLWIQTFFFFFFFFFFVCLGREEKTIVEKFAEDTWKEDEFNERLE